MCRHVAGAGRHVRPMPIHVRGCHARMKRDGEAVLQSLTAVWRGMRYLRECDEKGNDLEEVERVVRKGLCYGRLPSGSSFFVRLPQVTLRATQRLQSWNGFTVLLGGVSVRRGYIYGVTRTVLRNYQHPQRKTASKKITLREQGRHIGLPLHRRAACFRVVSDVRCWGGPACPPYVGTCTGVKRTDEGGRRSCPTIANRCVARNALPAGM